MRSYYVNMRFCMFDQIRFFPKIIFIAIMNYKIIIYMIMHLFIESIMNYEFNLIVKAFTHNLRPRIKSLILVRE